MQISHIATTNNIWTQLPALVWVHVVYLYLEPSAALPAPLLCWVREANPVSTLVQQRSTIWMEQLINVMRLVPCPLEYKPHHWDLLLLISVRLVLLQSSFRGQTRHASRAVPTSTRRQWTLQRSLFVRRLGTLLSVHITLISTHQHSHAFQPAALSWQARPAALLRCLSFRALEASYARTCVPQISTSWMGL